METRESLPPPYENLGISRINPPKQSKFFKAYTFILKDVKNKRCIVNGIQPKVKQGKEKGEGSLSIPIVPLESWEISPMKASE
jgi:hypothetical protein